jgi:L-asparagine oxygenase
MPGRSGAAGMTGGPWRMLGPGVAELTLSVADQACAREVVAELAGEHSADAPGFLRAAPGLGHLLPAAVRAALQEMRYAEAFCALAVRGKCLDTDCPATPAHWSESEPARTLRHDIWLTLLAAQLGDPIAWAYLQDGRLFNDVLPIRGEEEAQTEHGSSTEMLLHVDEAFADARSDAFGLVCMRNAGAVPTTVAPLAALALSPALTDILFEPRFVVQAHGDERVRPVFTGSRGRPYVRMDFVYTRALDGDRGAGSALAALMDQASAAVVEVSLAPGEVLLVDNGRCLHGRRAFQARYDGTDRWLRRLAVLRDLRRTSHRRSAPDSRVLL